MRASELTVLYIAFCMVSQAQTGTRIDLQGQSRRVDFTAADSTRPVKTGTSLPATCTLGDLYFKSDAPSGSNLYGCGAANTWANLSAAAQGGSGTLTVLADGTSIGSRAAENFLTGIGILNTLADNGTQVTIQHSVDSAVVQTRTGLQAGTTLLCASAGASATAYTCSMNPVLNAYTTGMVLHWKPDVTAAGGATTLNIDTLGAKAVKLPDGTSDPTAADIVAGRMYDVWYDGTAFRLRPPGLLTILSTRPACAAGLQGRIWYTVGATGLKDDLSVCARDAANAYAWRAIY